MIYILLHMHKHTPMTEKRLCLRGHSSLARLHQAPTDAPRSLPLPPPSPSVALAERNFLISEARSRVSHSTSQAVPGRSIKDGTS